MQKATIFIDNEELKQYIHTLERVIDGEDIQDDSKDLKYSLEHLKDLLFSNLIKEDKSYDLNPEEVARKWLGYKKPVSEETVLQSVMMSYYDYYGEDFCREVTMHFVKMHPEMIQKVE